MKGEKRKGRNKEYGWLMKRNSASQSPDPLELPPGGESPRQLIRRIMPVLRSNPRYHRDRLTVRGHRETLYWSSPDGTAECLPRGSPSEAASVPGVRGGSL